jgi:neutral amino acid transport system permease protein
MDFRMARAGTIALLVGIAVVLLPAGAQAEDQTEDQTEAASEEASEPVGDLAVSGTIRDGEGEPVADATITVSQDDTVVGETTTDDRGRWEVAVPGPGSYSVLLDEDTLPEGVTITEGSANPVRVRVLSGNPRPVLFRLGEGGAGQGGVTADLLQRALNGIKVGLIIAITSIGLSLIFGTTGMINFAHGELVSLGAILAWFLNREGLQLQLIIAALIAVALMAGIGGLLERGLFRPLRHRQVGLFQLLVITIGLSLLLQNVLLIWFGGSLQPYGDYVGQRSFSFGSVNITPRDLIVMALSVLVLVAVASMLQFTRIGKAMRAVADNRDLAESSGINVEGVVLRVWMLGTALAGVGGIFAGIVFQVDFLLGFRLLLLMFAGIILGGLGTAYGAMVGGLVVGLATELSTAVASAELKNAWALLVLIVVLLFRPQGILGQKERIG